MSFMRRWPSRSRSSVEPNEPGSVSELVRREMTGALDPSVPLEVDLAAGPNWLDVEPLPDVPAG